MRAHGVIGVGSWERGIVPGLSTIAPSSHRTNRGFTLLEVMLALTIFGLVTLGVLSTFRTASRSFERSGRAMAELQIARAVQDTIGRDIRSVFLVNETNYGTTLRGSEGEENPAAIATAAQSTGTGSADSPYTYGTSSSGLVTDQVEVDASLAVDLAFTLSGGGDRDEITFVRRLRPLGSVRAQMPGGLVRVTYHVDEKEGETSLVRTTQSIFGIEEALASEEDAYQSDEEREQARLDAILYEEPQDDVLARGITVFDVRAIAWADGEWQALEDWNSSDREARNALAGQSLPDDDPNAGLLKALVERMPEDGLPAALEVNLGLNDPYRGTVRMTRLLVPLPPARETWAQPDEQLMDAIQRSQRQGRTRE